MSNLVGQTTDPGVAGVLGKSSTFNGVLGVTTADGHAGVAGVCDTSNGNGVYGRSKQANGVMGISSSDGGAGVAGANDDGSGNGVYGRSAKNDGVIGITTGDGKAGVAGVCDTGNGNGLYGRGIGNGVYGIHVGADGAGVVGVSDLNDGVRGFSKAREHAGLVGTNSGAGVGVLAQSPEGIGLSAAGGFLAGYFQGDVEVTGDIRLANADCAEDFDVACVEQVEPGTVMVIDAQGALKPSIQAYDKRVAGVISGAGNYKPGIVLDKQPTQGNRSPIALLGKVYCKVDARYGAIEVGDLLTTSDTPGHAMKAVDPFKAFGSVIGKALRPLSEGEGLIPLLIALQ